MKDLEKEFKINNIENVIVLCRGKSIEKIDNLNKNILNEKYAIVFVNKFSELKNNELVLNLINEKNNNPFNVQYINNDQHNIENPQNLNEFKIKYVQANKKIDDSDASIQLKQIKQLSDYPTILDIHQETPGKEYKLKTNGMSCIGYLSTFNCIKNFYIFGLDFFEADYFSHHVHTGEKSVREYQPAKGKIAKKQLLELVNSNKGINYHLYTYANFNMKTYDNFFVY